MYRKWLSFILIVLILMMWVSGCGEPQEKTFEKTGPVTYENIIEEYEAQSSKEPVICWYTEDTDRKWLEKAAKDFQDKYSIPVEIVYYDGVSFFEDVNQANQKNAGPDVYIVGNDQLEFGISAGIMEENTSFDDGFWQDNYPETSKSALTYKGKQYGYPIYFDTYMLVYDSSLLDSAPASIDDILEFLNEYEDTGSTKAVFRWDVADPYINTMFIASYADLFGDNGDDSSSFTVNGDNEVKAMQYFQSLSEYLWMDKSNISHDTVINRIKEETLVLGLCKSDILPVLKEMNSTYKVSYVPSLTAELSSTCLSTTYGAFINPYGAHGYSGNMFALYLSYENQNKQFSENGKMPVVNQKDGFDDMQTVLYAQYNNSKPVPKTMLLGDYLTYAGIAFDAIWKGEDAKEQMDILQSTMEERIK